MSRAGEAACLLAACWADKCTCCSQPHHNRTTASHSPPPSCPRPSPGGAPATGAGAAALAGAGTGARPPRRAAAALAGVVVAVAVLHVLGRRSGGSILLGRRIGIHGGCRLCGGLARRRGLHCRRHLLSRPVPPAHAHCHHRHPAGCAAALRRLPGSAHPHPAAGWRCRRGGRGGDPQQGAPACPAPLGWPGAREGRPLG